MKDKENLAWLTIPRKTSTYRPVAERVHDYREVAVPQEEAASREQASRCMDCFLPFCHWACPLGNYVPDWNQALAAGDWQKAYRRLQATNNLPEVTARICPAPCEAACVLNISGEPVTIREDELAVIERAFEAGLVKPTPPRTRTGKSVAVIGSGPAGLACADQLNHAGHRITVFERDDKIGGLLRYGIPDFKMEKRVLDRRLALLEAEGITFATGTAVGEAYAVEKLRKNFDAVCLAIGARVPRELPVEGRELAGIYPAMTYLAQSNRRVAGERIPSNARIDAQGRRVVVIGGGDTGADCVGTAHRQGARRVTQIEILPRPPEHRTSTDMWPNYPLILRTSTSHEEGGQREWAVQTTRFLGHDGRVRALEAVRVEWVPPAGQTRPAPRELPGTAFTIEADLVLLAMGFVGAERHPLLETLGVRSDTRGAIKTDDHYMTSVPGVFSAGDARRGQSLVVWAIAEGRHAAHYLDAHLMGASALPLL